MNSSRIWRRLALLAAFALYLPACSASIDRSIEPAVPERPKVDEALKRPAPRPAAIPDRDLTGEEVARLWFADRRALGICRIRHGGLVDAVNVLTHPKEPVK